MNWQELIVWILVIVCVVEIVRRVILFFQRTKENDNPCATCSTGCDLKRMMDEKQQECRQERKKPNKNCCG